LLLEMYPPTYKELIENLKNEEYNIIIINRRRPVTLEKESIKILQNSNCKLISKKDLFKKDDIDKISLFTNKCSQKIEEIWNKQQNFNQIFKFYNIEFWGIIENDMLNWYFLLKKFMKQLILKKLFHFMKLVKQKEHF